jgi:organic radical activating enzyme
MKQRIVIDHSNTNKQLRHYDADGDYMRLSVDETIARGLNTWQGWSCSAGIANLYIDYDGNVWVCNTASARTNRFNYDEYEKRKKALGFDPLPVTEEGKVAFEKFKSAFLKSDASVSKIFQKSSLPGFLGNVYDGFQLPTEWFTCRWRTCGCGADVFLPKAEAGHVSKLIVNAEGIRGRERTTDGLVDEIEKSVATEPNFPIPHQILWDLGRKCNYDCSYCWPSVHNRDAVHKTLPLMKATADKLITDWANNQTIRWNFGGGEPTLNPDFLAFLEYLKKRNQYVLVTTNGSLPRKYWQRAIQYINSVNLSVHFEFADEQKLLANIEEICNHFDEHNDDHWLEIKLMAPPQFVERAVALREQINATTSLSVYGANGRIKGIVSIVPIRSLNDGGELVDYTEEQIKIIQTQ